VQFGRFDGIDAGIVVFGLVLCPFQRVARDFRRPAFIDALGALRPAFVGFLKPLVVPAAGAAVASQADVEEIARELLFFPKELGGVGVAL